VIHHYNPDSVYRVDEGQIRKVFAHLRAEAGDSAQRDELAAMETSSGDDVINLGVAALPVSAGKLYFEQRRAERAASPGT
jgi:hypothetical protein